MNKFLLVILLLSFNSSYAQITLGSSDFPSANDMYVMSDADTFPGMNAAATGPNYIWDYSLLSTTTTGQHTDTIFPVTGMNIIYQAVFGDFGFLPNRSNQATHGMDFTLGGQISITDVYNFYYNNSNDYHQSGFGAGINGIPAPTAYSPHDVVYKYPVAFGNLDSSASGYSVSLPNILYYGVNKNRVNEVDGWGTLTTPYGTFDVLRLKSVIHERDSVFLDTLGFGYGFNVPVQTEYKWLGAGRGEPLLQINVAGAFVTSIVYRDSLDASGISQLANPDFDFLLFPNPSTDKIILKYSVKKNTEMNFSVVDQLGNIVTSSEKKKETPGDHLLVLNLPAGTSAGNYFVKMNSDVTTKTKSFFVSK